LCDGSPLKDPTSPLKHSVCKEGRVPNLNGKFLRGTIHAGELLKQGGQAQQQLTLQLPIDLDTHYLARKDNHNLGGPYQNDPRDHYGYVTGSVALWHRAGDWARPGVKGETGARSYTVNTVPPFAETYYIILIK